MSIGAVTIVVTVLSALRERRVPRLGVMIAVVVSMVGIVMVCAPGIDGWGEGRGSDFVLGLLLSGLSGVAFGLQTLLNSKPIPGLTSKILVGSSFAIAGIVCMPWAAIEGFRFETMTTTSWTALIVLTFGSTLVGYLAYYTGLHLGV